MHFTPLNSAPQTFSRDTSFHHITPKDFTSHYLSRHTIPHHTIPHHTIPHHTIPHHTTIAHHFTSHYYIPHVPRRISQTFNVATHLTLDHHILHLTSHYTAVRLPPPFHTTTPQSTTYSTSHSHSPHLTPTTIPHHTHIQHHSIFHTTLYSTSHYTTTS